MDDAELGARLREARRERRLALADVESMSNREFKASVLGAYERGERQISVARLAKLVSIYDLTLPEFLGSDAPGNGASQGGNSGPGPATRESMIDIAALERFERADPSPAAVTMRDDEVRALAHALRRAMFEIESVLLDLERRGVRPTYP